MKHVLILNGPPNSGKDTIAEYLVKHHGFKQLEMKSALRKLAIQLASLQLGELSTVKCKQVEFNKELKDTEKVPAFGNRTWREFLIWISETVCKPIFGHNVFARAAAQEVLQSENEFIVFSDGGFAVERDYLATIANVYVLHVRDGSDWGTDSRGWLPDPWGTLHNVKAQGLPALYQRCDELAAAIIGIANLNQSSEG